MSVYDNNHKGNANENEVNTRSSSLSRTNFQASTFNMDRELSNFDALSRQPSLDLVGRQLSTDFPLKLNSQSLDIDDFMKSDLCSSFSNYLVPLGPEKTGSTVPNPPFLHDVSSQDRQLGFLQRSQMLSRLNGGSSNHARRSSDVFNFGSNEFSMMNMNATCNNAIAWQRYQNFLQQPNSGQMSSDYHPSSLEASHYNRHMRSSENMGFGMGGGGMGMMTPSQNAFSHSDFARGGTITPESSTKVARNESNSKDILSPQIETPIKTLSSTEANLSDGTELVHNVTPDTRSKNAHDNISLSSTQGTETKRFKPFHGKIHVYLFATELFLLPKLTFVLVSCRGKVEHSSRRTYRIQKEEWSLFGATYISTKSTPCEMGETPTETIQTKNERGGPLHNDTRKNRYLEQGEIHLGFSRYVVLLS